MSLFSKLYAFLEKIPWLNRKSKYSLAYLNSAQFFGVINDNLFKLLLVFMLIDRQGTEEASNITSLAGAIFVIPFLLFSSTAGLLADRFSKQRLLIGMKAVEIFIMSLAIFAFGFKSAWGSYTLLFLLATHSAIFGPSKYGIIPELVLSEKVPKANGLVTGFTYFAIIVGTFLASFLTDLTNRNFVIAVSVCLGFALIGFLSTFGIQKTPPQGSKKNFNFLFIREIYYTLVFCKSILHLLPAILGAAFFLFLGGFTQLNIIPFAIQSLHLQEVAGGYLFLSVAFGIALGSFLAGKLCKTKIELGLPCLAGLAISVLLLLIAIFSHILFLVVSFLFLLGVFGGMFIVPCDSFVQVVPPHEKRGQVIAACNFLSFAGVLLASFCLFFFSSVLKITSAQGFALMSLLTFLATVALTFRLSDYVLPFVFRLFLRPFYRISIQGEDLLEKSAAPLFIFRSSSWRDIFFLLGKVPHVHFFLPKKKASFMYRLLASITIVPSDGRIEPLLEAAQKKVGTKQIPCIVSTIVVHDASSSRSFWQTLFPLGVPDYLYVTVERPSKRTIIITISKES